MRKTRNSIRLDHYNYSLSGFYFITICAFQKKCLFGKIKKDLNKENYFDENKIGAIVKKCWQEMPLHFSNIKLDAFVIMPNHIHGIIEIEDVCRGTACRAHQAQTHEQFQKPTKNSIPTIVRSYKSAVTKIANESGLTVGTACRAPTNVWQRNYYEHIIRSEKSLDEIRQYVVNNIYKWEADSIYIPS